jgi:hypothetical protein
MHSKHAHYRRRAQDHPLIWSSLGLSQAESHAGEMGPNPRVPLICDVPSLKPDKLANTEQAVKSEKGSHR